MFSIHESSIRVSSRGKIRRRDFLRTIPLGAAAAGALAFPDLLAAKAPELKKRGMACILLWMNGGPSQLETLDPKPDHPNGGETKGIATKIPGVQISEHLPQLAGVLDRACLIRSLTTKEGSHPRATYLMHTGYLPTASVKYPAFGSHAAKHLGDVASDLPSFVRIGRARGYSGGGFLGVDYDPFEVASAGKLPDNSSLLTSEARFERRLGLLNDLDGEFAAAGGENVAADHKKLYAKTARMIRSPKMEAFDLARETDATRQAYGSGEFANGCLLARRLLEAGVVCVEITSNGWDTHQDNFAQTKRLCGEIDRPWAQLLTDLQERGMLERTLVVWMGEFGRTPRVNARGGRDHYPRAFSAALAGAGIRGGQAIGRTDPSGTEVADRPVTEKDLFRTMCRALGIDADQENMSGIGRPIKIVDGGEAIAEAFS